MEKDDIDIRNLREWQPLDDLFHQIPASIRRGLFLQDLNVTCCDVVAEFLALGTDAGIIFWYHRLNGHTQKLRAEVCFLVKYFAFFISSLFQMFTY